MPCKKKNFPVKKNVCPIGHKYGKPVSGAVSHSLLKPNLWPMPEISVGLTFESNGQMKVLKKYIVQR